MGCVLQDRQHAKGHAVMIPDRAEVEVQPDILKLAIALDDSMPVAKRQGAAVEHDPDNPGIERRKLRPCLGNRTTQEIRMALTGEGGVGVIVKHDAVGSPKYRHRHAGAHHQTERLLQDRWPRDPWPKGREAPIQIVDMGRKPTGSVVFSF